MNKTQPTRQGLISLHALTCEHVMLSGQIGSRVGFIYAVTEMQLEVVFLEGTLLEGHIWHWQTVKGGRGMCERE